MDAKVNLITTVPEVNLIRRAVADYRDELADEVNDSELPDEKKRKIAQELLLCDLVLQKL